MILTRREFAFQSRNMKYLHNNINIYLKFRKDTRFSGTYNPYKFF